MLEFAKIVPENYVVSNSLKTFATHRFYAPCNSKLCVEETTSQSQEVGVVLSRPRYGKP
jgi:hypothetical protein